MIARFRRTTVGLLALLTGASATVVAPAGASPLSHAVRFVWVSKFANVVPGATALPGYRLVYRTGFPGATLDSTWDVYGGKPGGDPGAQFGPTHVVVANNMLQLKTYRDPAYGDNWVTGGICQCNRPAAFGAFFVRSRVTGPGPNATELLFPADNSWPPEIDINESMGFDTLTTRTLHFGPQNHGVFRVLPIDLTKWHTWGVEWSRTKLVYLVDGYVWGVITDPALIPRIKMTLDLQTTTNCLKVRECPTGPQTMEVKWVAEFTKVAPTRHRNAKHPVVVKRVAT